MPMASTALELLALRPEVAEFVAFSFTALSACHERPDESPRAATSCNRRNPRVRRLSTCPSDGGRRQQ
jgi:hypothetical protein